MAERGWMTRLGIQVTAFMLAAATVASLWAWYKGPDGAELSRQLERTRQVLHRDAAWRAMREADQAEQLRQEVRRLVAEALAETRQAQP